MCRFASRLLDSVAVQYFLTPVPSIQRLFSVPYMIYMLVISRLGTILHFYSPMI